MKDNFGNEEKNIKHKNIIDPCHCFPTQRLEDINAGSGSAGPFTVSTGTVYTLPSAVNVVSVSVDADDFPADPFLKEGCRCRKLRVLLTFIADITINALAIGTTFNFNLIRSTNKSSVTLGPVSTFDLTTGFGFPFVVGHAFKYLDKNLEPDNYTYSVQIAPGSLVTGTTGALGASALIQSATLDAIAAFI